MVNAVLFTNDARLSSEVFIWMKDLTKSVVLKKSYKSFEEFKEEAEKKKEPSNGAPVEIEKPEDRYIRVAILDADILPAKPVQWISELKKYLSSHDFVDPTGSLQILILAFDGGSVRIDAFQNEIVDDLILKPLDRALFLQKVELLSGESSSGNSFLFRQKTNQLVEVGKDIVIDEISEFAIAVRNPGPLNDGVFAAVHCDAFGERSNRRMIARVFESVRHPVREGEYLVKFSFYGVNTDQLANIRKYVRTNQTQVRTKGLENKAAGGATAKAAVPAAAAGKMPSVGFLKTKKVAVIDMNPDVLNEMKSAIESGFKSVSVKQFPSYARLIGEIRRLAPSSNKGSDSAAATAAASSTTAAKDAGAVVPEQALPGGKKLSVILRGKTHDLVKFEPVKKADMILGRTPGEWTEKPEQWMNAVEGEDKDGLIEFFTAVESGSSGKTFYRMRDSAGRIVHLMAAGSLEKSGSTDGAALLKIDIEEIDAAKWKELSATGQAQSATPKDPSHYRFEAIVIDGAYVRPDPQTWYNGLTEALRSANIIGADDLPPKIILLVDPRSGLRPEDCRIKGISDFMWKPIDRRFVMQKMTALLPGLVPNRETDGSQFVPCELNARIGKEVIMDELSEFGLSILQPSPFREKIYMRFFSKLFGEQGGWVAGRCLMCEKGKDGEPYRCHFTFFGASDDHLKRIRNWIREDYVAKKENAEKKA